MALLRLDRQGGDRTSLEPADADRLVGLFTIAVGPVLDAAERRVDLGDQLAGAVTGAELERPVGFGLGAVDDVGVLRGTFLKMRQGFTGFLPRLAAPFEQLLTEILGLIVVHERLVLGGTIIRRKRNCHAFPKRKGPIDPPNLREARANAEAKRRRRLVQISPGI